MKYRYRQLFVLTMKLILVLEVYHTLECYLRERCKQGSSAKPHHNANNTKRGCNEEHITNA
ncbi:MAG: hypothetical protein AB7F19_03265 [Candidatus Babeliales bacterium]